MALSDIFNPLLAAIKRALGPVGRLFDLIGRFWERLTNVFTRINELVDLIKSEISEWKRFKEDVRYRTSVINIPKAVQQTEEFIGQIVQAKDAIIDLWNELRDKLNEESPTEEAEQAVKDIEASGIKDLLSKFPRLLKGVEKILGFLAIVADALNSILNALDDLIAIVGALKAIREEVEHGSTVFLQQRNARRTVTLEDGTKMKIRIGSLH